MPADAAWPTLLAACQGRPTVTSLGVTGHQCIPPGAWDFVVKGVQDILREAEPPIHAVTSLAAGADQLVAGELLRAGAHLHVVVPSREYERTFTSSADLAAFRALLDAAQAVTRLDYAEPSEAAFLSAGKSVVDRCERLIAVWDGKPAGGVGGTADVVRYAQDIGRTVSVVWPLGVAR
jgi:hypothetical protein